MSLAALGPRTWKWRGGRQARALALLLLHFGVALAMQPEVKLVPFESYAGTLDCHGRVAFLVSAGSSKHNYILSALEYSLTGADPRCTNESSLASGLACKLQVFGISSCAAIELLAGTTPLAALRYDASTDGAAKGTTGRTRMNTTLTDLTVGITVVRDADGEVISCGDITVRCFLIFGYCFYVWARCAAGLAAVLAILDSAWLIRKHMLYNANPNLRRCTVRILLMVPIYSLQAFVALWFKVAPLQAEVFRFFRELYEAIVLFSFLQFILTCVGGPSAVVERFDGHKAAMAATQELAMRRSAQGGDQDRNGAARVPALPPDGEADAIDDSASDDDDDESTDSGSDKGRGIWELKHIFPWNWLCPRWRSAQQMLRWCVAGTLSYIIVSSFVSVFVLFFDLVVGCEDEHCESEMKVGKYLIMIASMAAINSLFELAHIFLLDLKELRPIPKFVSVKLVIFFTFWQGIVLSWLVSLGVFEQFIDPSHHWTSQEQISQAVQHALICFEMFGASVTHHFAFPPHDYKIVRRMHAVSIPLQRAMTLTNEEQTSMAKGLAVVDFRDILRTARFGFAGPNIVQMQLPSDSSHGSGVSDSESSDAE